MCDLTCSKKETCVNYPQKCKECGMTSDIINHHPKYQSKDINFVNKFVEKIVIEHSEKVDGLLFGEIQRMATDEGFETKITLYKSTIMDALRKQMPRRPDYYADGYADGMPVYEYANCPVCGHEFEEGINDWGCNYCQDCGQKLDWSDEE